jgi:hypothetical protein
MTNIKDLSKDDLETLKSTGLLKKLYPDAPNNFEDIKGKRPVPKKDINWAPLLRSLENILDDIEEREWNDEDNEVYIKEAVIQAVYGDSWYDFTNQFDS